VKNMGSENGGSFGYIPDEIQNTDWVESQISGHFDTTADIGRISSMNTTPIEQMNVVQIDQSIRDDIYGIDRAGRNREE
jgi:hypothetical protein